MKCYICGEEAKTKKHDIDLCHLCSKVDAAVNRLILKSADIELLNSADIELLNKLEGDEI